MKYFERLEGLELCRVKHLGPLLQASRFLTELPPCFCTRANERRQEHPHLGLYRNAPTAMGKACSCRCWPHTPSPAHVGTLRRGCN